MLRGGSRKVPPDDKVASNGMIARTWVEEAQHKFSWSTEVGVNSAGVDQLEVIEGRGSEWQRLCWQRYL